MATSNEVERLALRVATFASETPDHDLTSAEILSDLEQLNALDPLPYSRLAAMDDEELVICLSSLVVLARECGRIKVFELN